MNSFSENLTQSKTPDEKIKLLAFWCHTCKFEFQIQERKEDLVACLRCSQDFCEEIDPNEPHPKEFIPYSPSESLATANTSEQTHNRNPNRIEPLNSANPDILNYLMSSDSSFQEIMLNQLMNDLFLPNYNTDHSSFEEILQYIIENDPNQYGNPPASETAIKQLHSFSYKKTLNFPKEACECLVCKDEFYEDDKLVEMPCKHKFHCDCLVPWLKKHNSCPTCRRELQTDDNEYENRKKISHASESE